MVGVETAYNNKLMGT